MYTELSFPGFCQRINLAVLTALLLAIMTIAGMTQYIRAQVPEGHQGWAEFVAANPGDIIMTSRDGVETTYWYKLFSDGSGKYPVQKVQGYFYDDYTVYSGPIMVLSEADWRNFNGYLTTVHAGTQYWRELVTEFGVRLLLMIPNLQDVCL